jgi:predicted nuclease of predicted toxin-antitoxin system
VRVLIDEQLSESLLQHIQDLSADAVHVRLLGLGGAGDGVVWQRAIDLGCVLVTKDEDFHRLSVLRGAPPKVVWIRLGNCGTRDVASLLRERWPRIEEFVNDPVNALLELA